MKKYLTASLLTTLLITIVMLPTANGSWFNKGLEIIQGTGEDSSTSTGAASNFSSSEVAQAFKEALVIGTESVVGQLGTADGFNLDPVAHIPLPGELQTLSSVLSKIGMSHLVDDVELKLNRAAEAATPMAKDLFFNAITEMTFTDVMKIYNGPEDSATQYFKSKMSLPLSDAMRPIVQDTLNDVGAVQAYDTMIGEYKSIPFVPDVKSDLTDHVLEKGLDGIFYYIAQEEAAIRSNPLKQTTSLLKKVFGQN